MRKAIILGAMLAICASTAAHSQSFDASRQLEFFTTDALKATLAELGATTQDHEGVANITVTFSNGLKGDALLMACRVPETSTDCMGTSILVTYTTPDSATTAQIRDGIDEYNYRKNFGRAYLDPEGKVQVRFYVIADGGITMGNYRQQIRLFARSAADLPDYIMN